MAIQLRRGDYADFDPSRLLDGELAVVLENDPDTEDGTGLYACFGEDNVRRVMTSDEQVDIPVATTSTAGIVKPDGTTILADADGTIHGADVNVATTSTAGTVKPDGTSITVDNDGTIHALSTNADWKENNSNSSAYIKNKPFYSTYSVGSNVLSQTSCGGGASKELYYSGSYYVPVAENLSTSYDIASDSVYQVTVDDKTYTPTASGSVSYNMSDGSILTGSSSLWVSATFLIVCVDYKKITVFLPGRKNTTIASKNITIKRMTETITTIPVKFLPNATVSDKGAMSAADKTKLNGIATGATKNTASSSAPLVDGTASAGSSTDYARGDHVHPTDTSRASATDLSTHTGNGSIHVSTNDRATWNAKADESDLTSHTSDTTAHVTAAERATWDAKASTDTATMSANGLMSASDKSKLDGIGTKANGYYTTEVVNGDRVLTLVYDLVEE